MLEGLALRKEVRLVRVSGHSCVPGKRRAMRWSDFVGPEPVLELMVGMMVRSFIKEWIFSDHLRQG